MTPFRVLTCDLAKETIKLLVVLLCLPCFTVTCFFLESPVELILPLNVNIIPLVFVSVKSLCENCLITIFIRYGKFL